MSIAVSGLLLFVDSVRWSRDVASLLSQLPESRAVWLFFDSSWVASPRTGENADRRPRGRVGCRRAAEKELANFSSCGNVSIHYDFVGLFHPALFLRFVRVGVWRHLRATVNLCTSAKRSRPILELGLPLHTYNWASSVVGSVMVSLSRVLCSLCSSSNTFFPALLSRRYGRTPASGAGFPARAVRTAVSPSTCARRDSRLLTPGMSVLANALRNLSSCRLSTLFAGLQQRTLVQCHSPEWLRSAEVLLQAESVRSLLSKFNPSISRVCRRLRPARHVCGLKPCTCVSFGSIRVISPICVPARFALGIFTLFPHVPCLCSHFSVSMSHEEYGKRSLSWEMASRAVAVFCTMLGSTLDTYHVSVLGAL